MKLTLGIHSNYDNSKIFNQQSITQNTIEVPVNPSAVKLNTPKEYMKSPKGLYMLKIIVNRTIKPLLN